LPVSGPVLPVKKLEWRVAGVREAVAAAFVATDADGRNVALDWRNNVTEPVFSTDLTMTEVSKVLAAIREHVPADAVVLSWWDLSRKIRLIAQRQAPLDDPQARGLILPAAWNSVSGLVDSSEREFWGKGVPKADGEKFTSYIDALLLDEAKGADSLRALAPGGKDVYVAVHLSDVWKAAAARPDLIEIAYRDFPAAGQSHGVMKATREWISGQKIEGGYAVEPIGNAVRLHYFAKKVSSELLIAKMLPFSTSNPMRLERLQLVYQHRGFWVYKLN
ncbi:MAG: hydroxylamine oxidation protein HaoB, partial [Hyphomicrobium sp.]